jgi:hypothetical protein
MLGGLDPPKGATCQLSIRSPPEGFHRTNLCPTAQADDRHEVPLFKLLLPSSEGLAFGGRPACHKGGNKTDCNATRLILRKHLQAGWCGRQEPGWAPVDLN